MTALTLRHCTTNDLPDIRQLLLDVHDDCYSHSRDDFDTRERFTWFVNHWGSHSGFTCVIGYKDEEPIGYAYGAPATSGREWWRSTSYIPHNGYTATYHLSELMIRPKWRGAGYSSQIHDALLADRTDHLAALCVDITHPKVQELYEEWGYVKVGEDQPFADSPVFAVMVKELHTTAAA